MYWNANNQTYLPIDSKPQASEDDKKEKPKDAKQDKVKIAKKIAKDMEKWAKTLNQKKETRSWTTVSEPVLYAESTQTSNYVKNPTADAGFSLLEKQVADAETELLALEAMQQHLRAAELKVTYESDSKNQLSINISPYEIIKAEENRLTDWDKLACLLCKRQFSSSELLSKHQQLSDLHKVNKFKYFPLKSIRSEFNYLLIINFRQI
jgi:RNA-binding protein 5/10